MKKITILSILIISTIGILKAQTPDFRTFKWGSSFAQIQAQEKMPMVAKVSNDEIVYTDELGGSDCQVFYIFNDNDKLESGIYAFTKKYSNPQLYLQDYDKFKKLLTQKYGSPTAEKENWNTNTPKTDKNNFGQAILEGNLSLNTLWNTDRTEIKILLITHDKQPSLEIHYTTRSLDELESKEDLKKALIKL